MKILIVGGGGREHAIAWKLKQSPNNPTLFCAPGNAGIAQVATCVDLAAEDLEGIRDFAVREQMDLAVIGPEAPLAMGITDLLQDAGIRVFGPDRSCSRLEASKSFTKAFLKRHGIPTAGYAEFTEKEKLLENIGLFGYPMVLKADGLAAGKGVVLAEDRDAAEKAIEEMMGERIFGAAGDKVVVEEFLEGTEASVLCFVDGSGIVPMESAQDHKRIFDEDRGPNTGGMGTFSPSLAFTEALEQQIRDHILTPTFEGLVKDKLKFRGILFIGLMITTEGPKVIEFNNRFGDPETQSVLPRLESDLLEILLAVTEDRLVKQQIRWSEKRAVCVVLASGGYPGSYEKGKSIDGLSEMEDGVLVFHAGTKSGPGGEILTSGGRVLGVTAMGETHGEAREKAYRNVRKINFAGMQYRSDIGLVRR